MEIRIGDCLETLRTLPDNSVHCCVTSPPYWCLRDYGVDGQLGLEKTPEEYIAKMVEVFREVRRVLREDGTLWLNLGDSYTGAANSGAKGKQDTQYRGVGLPHKCGSGLKPKDLVGIPWRVALALQADGWYLRQDIIWHKPNPMPESVTDRCTKAHEYIFLLAKSERYYYDHEAVKEVATTPVGVRKSYTVDTSRFDKGYDGHRTRVGLSRDGIRNTGFRNRRSVWTVTTRPYKGAHFATFPPDLIRPCILAATSEAGCCAACGRPIERVTERLNKSASVATGKTQAKREQGLLTAFSGYADGQKCPTFKTVGWEKKCVCKSDIEPCVVLDPFGGSGTTGQVALEEGRDAILCELNPEYGKLINERLAKVQPVQKQIDG